MRRRTKVSTEAASGKIDNEQNFWPSYADMMSSFALILFFLMLLSYLSNIQTGNNLRNTEERLSDTLSRLTIAQAEVDEANAELQDTQNQLNDKENELNEIVQLVGKDSLSPTDQLTLEIARMLREDFLQQNAFMDVDSYSGFDRQKQLMGLILRYENLCRGAIAKGVATDDLYAIPSRERLGWAKYTEADKFAAEYDAIAQDMEREIGELTRKAGEDE